MDLEAKDDGPDETEDETMVAVDDVVGAHVLQMDPLLFEELQRLVHILQTVDTHSAFGGFWLREAEQRKGERKYGIIRQKDGGKAHQSFTGEHLQQLDEHASVPQVQVEVRDATSHTGQDGVDPFGEGLLLDRLPLI